MSGFLKKKKYVIELFSVNTEKPVNFIVLIRIPRRILQKKERNSVREKFLFFNTAGNTDIILTPNRDHEKTEIHVIDNNKQGNRIKEI